MKNKSCIYIPPIIILTLLFYSCESYQNKHSQLFNKNLDIELDSTKIIRINLDGISKEIIYPDLIIDDKFIKSTGDTVYLAEPTSCLIYDESYYILDSKLNTIIELDINGNFIKKIGRKGKGPGEFIKPFSIHRTNDYFLVFDQENGRLQFFNKNFEYVNSLSANYFPFMQSLSFNSENLMIPTEMTNTYEIYKLENISREKIEMDTLYYFPYASFIKDGREFPHTIKAKYIGSNSICYFFHSFPFLFFSNQAGETVLEIELFGKMIDEIFEYQVSADQRGIAMHLTDIAVIDSRLVIVLDQKIIIFESLDNKYKIHKIYEIPSEYHLSNIDVIGNYMFTYEWSRARIIRFKLS